MMKILSLQDFDTPVFNDLATVSVIGDDFQYCEYTRLQDELQPFAKYTRIYPEVVLTPEVLATRESARTIGAGDLFLPVQDSILKKIANVWREKGFSEAVRLAAATNPEDVTKFIHWIATRLKWTLDLMERGIYQKEVLPTSGSGSIPDIVTTRDWSSSLVRCLTWHPHCTRLAVATRDDRIRIFSQGIPGIPILRHSAQKSICCLAWRPYTGRELAVACHSGILVWKIELGAASNSLSHALVLKQRNHVPVTSVTWHPEGDLLVSCSPTDLNMIIWDICKEEGVPLKRVGGGGLCFSKWSPCGSRLFVASYRNIFRVWNTGNAIPWHADRWTAPDGRIAVACFGPNLTLLFASTEDSATIFSLPLQENIFDIKKAMSIDDVKNAVPVIDLTKTNFASEDEDDYITVGGKIISMEWDPSGKYLAILFQESPVIALFRTKLANLSRVVEAKPICLIKGYPAEIPNCMQFYQKSSLPREEILLTIAWSSGRVQHLPLVERESIPVGTDVTGYTQPSFRGISNRTNLHSFNPVPN